MSDAESKTPSEMLAQEITERLLAEGLIGSSETGRVTRGLATGTLRIDDWRWLLVETANEESRRG